MTKSKAPTLIEQLEASRGRTKLAEKRLVQATNEAKDRFDRLREEVKEKLKMAQELYTVALSELSKSQEKIDNLNSEIDNLKEERTEEI